MIFKPHLTQSLVALEFALRERNKLTEGEVIQAETRPDESYFGIGGSEGPGPELENYSDKHG